MVFCKQLGRIPIKVVCKLFEGGPNDVCILSVFGPLLDALPVAEPSCHRDGREVASVTQSIVGSAITGCQGLDEFDEGVSFDSVGFYRCTVSHRIITRLGFLWKLCRDGLRCIFKRTRPTVW